jgi:cysteine synthase
MDCINEVVQVNSETALATSREIAVKEGIFVGISSGAAVAAAIRVSPLVPQRCISWLFNDGKIFVVGGSSP